MRAISKAEVEQILGPFDALDELGSPSGSGECWKATTGADEVVIKLIVREHEPGRFGREVAGLSRVASPYVMRVIDHGVRQFGLPDPVPFLKSEFIDGRNVREALTQAPPTDTELREFVFGLLEALAALGTAKIVHRDVKPENIVLRRGRWEEPVLIDLGLCRLLDASFTVYPWAIGTWPYMAPEQLQGDRTLYQTDMWALAVVSYEVATGTHPFGHAHNLPNDWLNRLRGGVPAPGNRPHAFGEFLKRVGAFQGFRRPLPAAELAQLRTEWR